MPAQQNNADAKPGNKARKLALWLMFVAVVGGALFVVHTVHANKTYAKLKPLPKAPPKKAVAVKKADKPPSGGGGGGGGGSGKESGGGGGKGVKDILGGPAFTKVEPAPPIRQASLRGGAPEPPVKTSLSQQTPKTDAEAAPTPAPPALPPTPQLPPFPKTNVPTLTFTSPPPKTQPAGPPPPPPPKPRATLLLPNVSGRLADRADVSVSMSVELSYESGNALREELEFKRDMLSTVAASVLRRHEYGSVNAAILKTEMLSAFNGHLQAGKLSEVEIKDFQIGQAVAGK